MDEKKSDPLTCHSCEHSHHADKCKSKVPSNPFSKDAKRDRNCPCCPCACDNCNKVREVKCRAEVAEYFRDKPHLIKVWWETPNPMLGNIKPNDLFMLRPERLWDFIEEARDIERENDGISNMDT